MINLQAYYENIKKKTGKTPADFKKLAEKKGFVINGNLKPDVKAGEVMIWLKEDFKLGRGHALSIYHSFKAEEEEERYQ
ncbi:DUF4287 domain-containing protein [Pedobacter nutrimenti]|uniref:DUF4287 domain-containing protein n=1 Tax=Pedobacter nutrimenti TaxID=1241337 RepID=UPI00292E08CF|nr:DUF4287 domain-containing protein [Pedobacter nutrimenti]